MTQQVYNNINLPIRQTMCTTFFIVNPLSKKHPKINFIIGFNRDEYINRKALKFNEFNQDSNVWAGRDVQSGGTWLGFNKKTGIFIFLTNYFSQNPRNGISRGQITKQFLSTSFFKGYQDNPNQKIVKRMQELLKDYEKYNEYNLHVFHIFSQKMYYMCSEIGMKSPKILEHNKLHGSANVDLFSLAPKVKYGIQMIEKNVFEHFDSLQKNQIIERLNESLNNKKKTTQQAKSSIFVERYFDDFYKHQRMTKSQFLGIIQSKESAQGKVQFEFSFKQNIYDNQSKIQSFFQGKVTLNQ